MENGNQKTFFKKDILIIGSGNSVLEHKEAIIQFINKNKPIVIALNSKKVIMNN